MVPLANLFRRLPRTGALMIGVVSVVVLAWADFLTGPDITLTTFYLIPVGFIAWYLDIGSTLLALACCVGIWFGLDYAEEQSLQKFKLYWEVFSPIPMFILFIWVVRACRRLLGQVEQLIGSRTASLRAELAARNEAAEAQRRLAQEVAIAEENQRRRIAQDLHDSVGQDLSALTFSLRKLQDKLQPDGRDELVATSAIVDRLIAQTRDLSFQLYPTALDELGLHAALQLQADQLLRGSGVAMEMQQHGTSREAEFSRDARLTVYRVVKELVANASKHGGARTVLVTFFWQSESLRLVVDDNGKGLPAGFTPEAEGVRHQGLGLRWIRDWACSLKGDLHLESLPGAGTRVIALLPLSGLKAQGPAQGMRDEPATELTPDELPQLAEPRP